MVPDPVGVGPEHEEMLWNLPNFATPRKIQLFFIGLINWSRAI